MDKIRITQEKNGSIVKSQDESESQQEKKVDFYLYQTNKGVKVGCIVEDSLFSLKPYQGVINENWKMLLKVQCADVVSLCKELKPDILLNFGNKEQQFEKNMFSIVEDSECGLIDFGGTKCFVCEGLDVNEFKKFYQLLQLIDQCKSVKNVLCID